MDGDAVLLRSRPRVSLLDYRPDEVRSFLVGRLRGRVLHAFLFGSFVRGDAGAWSDVDLLLVADTELPMVERSRAYGDLLELGIPVDILVYTPEEFQRLRSDGRGFWAEFERDHERLL